MLLSVALVVAMMTVASVMPAFAQGRGEGAQGEAVGPEGGNPGQGVPQTQEEHPSAGKSGQKPLPFGGTEPEAGLNNAPGGVVCTAPGSPFHPPEGC
jgi:hypothetical protein